MTNSSFYYVFCLKSGVLSPNYYNINYDYGSKRLFIHILSLTKESLQFIIYLKTILDGGQGLNDPAAFGDFAGRNYQPEQFVVRFVLVNEAEGAVERANAGFFKRRRVCSLHLRRSPSCY